MTRLARLVLLPLLLLAVLASTAHATDWVEVVVTPSDLDAEAIAAHERTAQRLSDEAALSTDPREQARLYKASGDAWAQAADLRTQEGPGTRLRVVDSAPGSARAKAVAWLRAHPTKRGGLYYVYAKQGRLGISRNAPRSAPQPDTGLFERPVGGGSATYPEEELRRLARKDEYRRQQQERRRARAERRREQQARRAQESREHRARQIRKRKARERRARIHRRTMRLAEARARQQAALRAQQRAAWEAQARRLREHFRKQRAIRVGDTSAASRANGTLFK